LILVIVVSFISTASAGNNTIQNQSSWASAESSGFESYKAFDNNLSTVWLAGSGTWNWVGIDLGTNYLLINMSVMYVSVTAKEVYINGSLDNITWTQISYEAANTGGTVNYNIGGIYRYLNITIIGAAAVAGVTDVKAYAEPPTLFYPAINSSLYKNYPPLTTDINFSWERINSYSSNLLISKDSSFNIIAVDTTTANNFSIQSLEAGDYWWKVRYYNSTSGTYGSYSDTSNFTLTNNVSATSGVQGIVYELLGGTRTAISEATVYIYNNSWSSSMITGSNGYYLFSGLGNGTYNLYAARQDYDTTPILPVTVNGSITTNDILMKRYISPYVPNFVYEKFIVRSLFDDSYIGVTATVYEGDSLTTVLTGTTDSMGQVVFRMTKDQRYRVVFSGGGIGDDITIYVFAKEESYLVRILSGFPIGGDRYTDIKTNLTAITINSTWSNLTLIYNDTISSTTQVWFYGKNLSTGVICYQSSTANVVTLQCPVLSSGRYQLGFNATSSKYGFFQQDTIFNFGAGKPSTPAVDTGMDKTLLQWTSIIFIVITASLFSIRSKHFGAVIVPLEALVLWVFGWFETIVNNSGGSFLLLSCAVFLGVMVYLRQSEAKTVY